MAVKKTSPAEEEPDGDDEKPTWRQRLSEWLSAAQFATTTILVILLLLVGFLWKRVFISIPAGNLGVMYLYLQGGTVTERVWSEGLHVIAPWNELTAYEIRLQQKELKFTVLSEEGLDLDVTVSIRYHLRPDMLGFLQKDVGADYYERLLKPEVQAHVRRTFGGRPAHEIYGSSRDVLQELAHVPVIGKLDLGAGGELRPYMDIEELKVLDIGLPAIVQASIAEKYRQEQLMLEYKFKLDREQSEAERKRTEAAGIRDYNMIASKVSPDLLRWRGIDALSDLAKSQNSKVIILGGGSSGVPLILNVPDSAAAAPTSEPSAAPSASAVAVAVAAPTASSSATVVASAAVPSALPSADVTAVPTAVASAAPVATASASAAATGKAAP
jgi:regulator of protease activity HflC (stomatin/prohibitin superfamily)